MKVIVGTYRADKDMISRCVDSIKARIAGVDRLIFVDDSGNQDFRNWLYKNHGEVVAVAPKNVGYSRAMDVVCEVMRSEVDEYFAFWEEDFTAVADTDLNQMADELANDPTLAQVVLLRQPWFANEIAKGDVIEAMSERLRSPIVIEQGVHQKLWVHQMQFSCNPAVWAPMAYRWPWPQCINSEDAKTRYLVDDDGASFAFFGNRVRVHHEGERLGKGY